MIRDQVTAMGRVPTVQPDCDASDVGNDVTVVGVVLQPSVGFAIGKAESAIRTPRLPIAAEMVASLLHVISRGRRS